MTRANLEFQFLRSQASACTTYLRILRTASSESHRQQALDNALQAYTTIRAYLPSADLAEEERLWLTKWIEETVKELSPAQAGPSRDSDD